MKKILLVTDFSPGSEHACDYAVQLFGKDSKGHPIHYHFLHIHELAAAVSPHAGVYVTTSAEVIEQGIALQEKRLSRFVGDFREKYPEVYFDEHLEIGPTIPTIREIAEKKGVHVVVAGTSGLSAVDRAFMGSTSLALAQKSPCPVLLVPRSSEIAIPEKIVLATDFHDLEKREVLPEIKDLANDLGCQLMLLHVRDEEADSHVGTDQIEALKNYFENRNCEHFVLEDKDVSTGIKEFVVGYGAEILALVGQPRTFLGSIFHNSVRKKILAGLSLPLFILHPLRKSRRSRDPEESSGTEAQ